MMTMQTRPEQLKRQQAIMKKFGFYKGKIDGIWGPMCIASKRAFEASPEFKPGYPNNGMPFKGTGPFPKGIRIDVTARTMLTCEGVEEILKEAARESSIKNEADIKAEKHAVETGSYETDTSEILDDEFESESDSDPEVKPLSPDVQIGSLNKKKKKHRR